MLGDEELSLEQATCIARAMWKVAEVEKGVHQKEREMIDEFYLSCVKEAGGEPQDLSAKPWDAEEANRLLTTPAQKETLLRSCYLLGYADGQCSPLEMATIDQMAQAMGVPPERREAVDREVKRMLLSQFDDIKLFRNATYDIGRQLGLSPAEVDDILRHEG
jgi:tellurite resistance protein